MNDQTEKSREQERGSRQVEPIVMRKKKPTPNGFIAVCECGAVVGALDFNRTDRKDASNTVSEWLMTGHP